MDQWQLDTRWFDVAGFLFLLLMGHILLGHFEDYKPMWRRVLKAFLGIALFVAVLSAVGRMWTWIVFGVPIAIGLVVVHGWWLPKQGINGWTGEPREKYLALVKARPKSGC